MNNICTLNQNITDKWKHLDEEEYQKEYNEHCRKMSIIDSYEEEIKEVLFLSSGCVHNGTYSYKEYSLGISPNYINLENIVDKIQALKSKRLGLNYVTDHYYCGYFPKQSDEDLYSIKFIYKSEYKDYTEHFVSTVNKYSKEFYDKEYFQRWEGSFFDSYKTLVTKDETWNMEYLRMTDTLKSWKGFTVAALVPVFGWLFILYSMYEAVRLYLKHRSK